MRSPSQSMLEKHSKIKELSWTNNKVPFNIPLNREEPSIDGWSLLIVNGKKGFEHCKGTEYLRNSDSCWFSKCCWYLRQFSFLRKVIYSYWVWKSNKSVNAKMRSNKREIYEVFVNHLNHVTQYIYYVLILTAYIYIKSLIEDLCAFCGIITF